MSDKLKPCPFCGARAERCLETPITDDDAMMPSHFIKCETCDASSDVRGTRVECVNLWNTRVDDAKLKLAVEKIESYDDLFDAMEPHTEIYFSFKGIIQKCNDSKWRTGEQLIVSTGSAGREEYIHEGYTSPLDAYKALAKIGEQR